ncbi:unnamed protein product [Adineta steineri]|uniref:Uncharacterized protein n=1 Tax=Adineta steineri TaxID=433720 RepID=A0A814YYZ3_9BILA|nr:unnamed protein product [Adineta steineri]CAF1243591.1 unnamed protein product [Adineta steineri]CAF1263311.1 unnamed protein product [Adineta steineri]
MNGHPSNTKQQHPKNIKQLPPNHEQQDSLGIPSNCSANVESSSNMTTTNNNKNNNKKYFKVLLISFGVLLILGVLACVVMGIYALVYINKTTVASTTVTTSTTSTTTTFLPPQCYSYMIINDTTRLITAGSGSATDYGLFSTSTLVRFFGAGGTQIATSPTGGYHCGSTYNGWYAGALPSFSNTVSGIMCYTDNSSPCTYYNTILVTNCDSFYVYDLINPPNNFNDMRYCTV